MNYQVGQVVEQGWTPALRGSGDAWFALRVRGGREKTLEALFRYQGVETFLPMETRWRHKSRYSKRREKRHVPSVPGVIFCRLPLPTNWPVVLSIPNVFGVLSQAGWPRAFLDREMTEIAQMDVAGRAVDPARRHMRKGFEFDVGDQVAVAQDHPFAGFPCKVEAIAGSQAAVVFQIFGRETKANVGLGWLVADAKKS